MLFVINKSKNYLHSRKSIYYQNNKMLISLISKTAIRNSSSNSIFTQLFNKHTLSNSKLVLKSSSVFVNRRYSNDKEHRNEKWKTIYRLPAIRFVSAFNRLKIYQLGLLGLGAPITFALEASSSIPIQSTLIFFCTGLTGLITLTLGSLMNQNLIGVIYLNAEKTQLKISHVDFWGKRCESIHSVDSILDVSQSKLNLYQIIQTGDKNSATYKLLHRFCDITDPYSFTSIFGD